MKSFKIKFFSLVFGSLLISSVAFANNEDVKPIKTKDFGTELVELIQNPGLVKKGIETAKANIHFKANENGDLEVAKVVAETEYLETFIKEKLEEKTFDLEGIKAGQTYIVKVTFRVE